MDLGSLVRRLVPGARAGGTDSREGQPGGLPVPPGAGGDVPPVGAWRSVPAIRSTIGDAPLVAPNAPFRDGLAAAQRAPVALAPLGHGRGLEAPSGLAAGIATPVARTPAEPVPSTVRRPAAQRRRDVRSVPTTPSWAADDDGTPEVAAAAAERAAEPVPGSPPDAIESAAATAARPLQAPGDRPSLVAAPPVTAPMPSGRLGAAATAAPAGASSGPAVSRAADPAAEGLAAHGADRPASFHDLPATAGGPPASPAAASSAQRPSVGPARRIRLGSPIAGPTAPLTSRLAASAEGAPGGGPAAGPAGAMPPSVARSPAVGRASGPDRAPMADAGPTGPAPADRRDADASAGAAPIGVAPFGAVQRAAADAGRAEAPTAAALTSVVPWPAAPPRSRPAPLAGTLRPVIDATAPSVAMRAAAPEASPDAEAEAGTPSAALAALARADPSAALGGGRWPDGGPSHGAGPRPAGTTPSDLLVGSGTMPLDDLGAPGSPFTVARSSDTAGGAPANRLTWSNPWLPGAPAPSGAAGAPTVGHGRSTVAGSTAAGGSAGEPPVAARAQAALPPAGFAPRPAALRVGPAVGRGTASRSAAPAEASAAPAGSGPDMPVSLDAAPPIEAAEMTVARAAADAGPVSLAPLQRVDASPDELAGGSSIVGAAGGGTGSPTADKDLDELARRLYDRIGLRLRGEMLVERERAGLLVDRGF